MQSTEGAVHGGLAGDEGAAEVGVYPVVLLGVIAGLVGLRGGGRWPFPHLDRARESGDVRAYPPAQPLTEFVGDDCTEEEYGLECNPSGGIKTRTELTAREAIGVPVRTESSPRAAHGGGAGEVSGVVEAVEDAGGCVGA